MTEPTEDARVFDPWTRSLYLAWVPELRFYERRFAVLRHFADAGYLDAFRNREDRTGAMLGGHRAECEVTATSMALHVDRSADLDMVQQILGVTLDELQPDVHSVAFFAQFVVPLPGPLDYDEARQKSANAHLGPVTAAIDLVDYSVLADGRAPGGRQEYQVEYGLLIDEELPDRLTRHYGRGASAPAPSRPLASRYRGVLDGPALFADMRWLDWPMALESLTPQDVLNSWDESVDASIGIVRDIYGFVWPVENAQLDGGEVAS